MFTRYVEVFKSDTEIEVWVKVFIVTVQVLSDTRVVGRLYVVDIRCCCEWGNPQQGGQRKQHIDCWALR